MEKISLYNGKVTIFKKGKSYYSKEECLPEQKIMSVTRGLGCLAKDALKFWSSGCAAGYMFDNWDIKKTYTKEDKIAMAQKAYTSFLGVVKKKAGRGSQIHEFAEDYFNGKNPEMPTDPNVLNGVNAFLEQANKTDLIPVKTERLVYSKRFKIVGLLDLDAKKKRKGTKHVVDYKTVSMYKAAKAWELGKWPDGLARDKNGEVIKYPVFLEPMIQASIYRGMIMEETGDYYDESYIWRFDQQTGEFDCETLSPEFQDEAYEMYCDRLLPVKSFLDKHEIKPY